MIIFLLDWITIYFYMHSKTNTNLIPYSQIDYFGYIFVFLNSFQGLYVFIFHCIQNEKVRREYRKYIRQQIWIPKCLHCSKSNLSSPSSNNNPHVGQGSLIANSNTLTIDCSATSINITQPSGSKTLQTRLYHHYEHHGFPIDRSTHQNSVQTSPSTSSIGSNQLIYSGSTIQSKDSRRVLKMTVVNDNDFLDNDEYLYGARKLVNVSEMQKSKTMLSAYPAYLKKKHLNDKPISTINHQYYRSKYNDRNINNSIGHHFNKIDYSNGAERESQSKPLTSNHQHKYEEPLYEEIGSKRLINREKAHQNGSGVLSSSSCDDEDDDDHPIDDNYRIRWETSYGNQLRGRGSQK